MPLDPAANFARDALQSGVTDTDTTFSVSNAAQFPDPSTDGEFNVVVWDAANNPRPDQDPDVEIVRVTAVDTGADTLTVTRAEENTAAASHPVDSGVLLAPTEKTFSDIEDLEVEGFTTAGGSGTVPTSQGDGTLAMESVGVDDSGNVLGGSAVEDSSTAVHPTSSAGDGFYHVILGNEASAGNGINASVAIGREAEVLNSNEGILGSASGNRTTSWIVPGDFTVNGSKNFQIDHPAYPDTHDLRHGNYEGDVAGGLIYRRTVTVSIPDGYSEGSETISMPDWFGPLATDVDVVVQAQGHFGDAYAERDEPTGETITVHANTSGDYKLIIFATRDDSNVPNPKDHAITKPKGERWNGEPRSYYRDAPGADLTTYEGVERIEQFFEHTKGCSDTPCESAFVEWRVTLADGERVDVDKPVDASIDTVVAAATGG